jgi:hypothetical protein
MRRSVRSREEGGRSGRSRPCRSESKPPWMPQARESKVGTRRAGSTRRRGAYSPVELGWRRREQERTKEWLLLASRGDGNQRDEARAEALPRPRWSPARVEIGGGGQGKGRQYVQEERGLEEGEERKWKAKKGKEKIGEKKT